MYLFAIISIFFFFFSKEEVIKSYRQVFASKKWICAWWKMGNDFKQVDIYLFVRSEVIGEIRLIRNSSKRN